jgi:uncharacterized membrane protein
MAESNLRREGRIEGIDALRGLVVMIMALDHAREFFAPSPFSPTDASATTGLLYFTRWITHLCAPTFVVLAGMSCFLMRARLVDDREYRNFLVTRGLILIAIECSLVALGWDFEFREINLQVIWVLGASMVCLGLMYRVPRQAMLWLGIALCLVSYEVSTRVELTNPLLTILFGKGKIALFGHVTVQVTYSLAPWLGVMMFGYGCAEWTTARLRQERPAIWLGLLIVALTLLVRAFTTFGEANAWHAVQGDPVATVMMFLDLTKYPPSPLYLACMVGLAFTLLFAFAHAPRKLLDLLKVYGRAPLLFYVAHLYVIQILRWSKVAYVHFALPGYLRLPPDSLSLGDMRGLYWTYLVCAIALAVLYKPCQWFYQAKKARSMKILSYL